MNAPSWIRFLLFAGPLVPLAHAQEWTRFRGPGGSGLSQAETVPVAFGEEDVRWRVRLPGKGHSSPVVWGRRVFLTCMADDEGLRRVVCLEVADGKELWHRDLPFDPHGQHELNSFASSTPAVDEDHVYVTWTSGGSYVALALDHTGELVWRRSLGNFRAQHGSGSSPILFGDVLVVCNDNDGPGFVVGLDRRTGETDWRRERAAGLAAYSTPYLHAPQGRAPQIILSSTAHGLTSLDPRTGELHWEIDGLFETRCVGSPVVADGVVFATAGIGGGGRESVAVRLPAGSPDSGPEVGYRLRRALPYVPTPIGVGKWLFLWSEGGIVTCLEAATGEEVWRERVDGRFFGSAVCVDGRLYAISTAGELVVIAAAEEFQLLGRVDLGEPSQATPAVAGGVLYLRTETHLVSVAGEPTTTAPAGTGK